MASTGWLLRPARRLSSGCWCPVASRISDSYHQTAMITAHMRKDAVHCSLHGYVFGERSPRNQQRHAAADDSRRPSPNPQTANAQQCRCHKGLHDSRRPSPNPQTANAQQCRCRKALMRNIAASCFPSTRVTRRLATRAKSMKKTGNLCNLRQRPLRPAAGNGRLQEMARRLLDLRGRVTAPEVVEYAYADRLLLRRERCRRWFYWASHRALESIGAVRIRRLSSIGRPWVWARPNSQKADV